MDFALFTGREVEHPGQHAQIRALRWRRLDAQLLHDDALIAGDRELVEHRNLRGARGVVRNRDLVLGLAPAGGADDGLAGGTADEFALDPDPIVDTERQLDLFARRPGVKGT